MANLDGQRNQNTNGNVNMNLHSWITSRPNFAIVIIIFGRMCTSMVFYIVLFIPVFLGLSSKFLIVVDGEFDDSKPSVRTSSVFTPSPRKKRRMKSSQVPDVLGTDTIVDGDGSEFL